MLIVVLVLICFIFCLFPHLFLYFHFLLLIFRPNEHVFEVPVENVVVANVSIWFIFYPHPPSLISFLIIKNIAIGDIVSFSFETYSRRDTPVHPKILRIRQDITWQNVIHNFLHNSHDQKGMKWSKNQKRKDQGRIFVKN